MSGILRHSGLNLVKSYYCITIIIIVTHHEIMDKKEINNIFIFGFCSVSTTAFAQKI